MEGIEQFRVKFEKPLEPWEILAKQGRILREERLAIVAKTPTFQEKEKLALADKVLAMSDQEFEKWNKRRLNWEKHLNKIQEIKCSQ